jgi:hypothetical protein
MHKTGQKSQCTIPTCERHNGKGFPRSEQLQNRIRRKHPNYGDNIGRCQKRKADVDWDESFQVVKRLREDTRDLNNQFAALVVQLVEIALLIR